MNAALYRTDETIIVPRVESTGSLDEIVAILARNKIDVVMVGSEFDLVFFSRNKALIESQTNALIVAAPLETVHIADDKWLTAEFLRGKGLPYAEAWLPSGMDDAVRVAGEWGYPVVLKTRRGTSSRHVHIVKDWRMLEECYSSTPLPMLQRVIDIPTSELHNEYTCSIFKMPDGKILGPFTARRTVRGGTSWHVEVARFNELDELLLAIGHAIDFIGSLNVQLMLTKEGPVPFELNARFSGTTAVRAHFGFNEPEMALRAYYYREDVPVPIIRSGIALRYHEEVFVDDVRADELRPSIHKGYVNKWF
jgi:carbamoyl-phosphate synthase large subunit